MISGGEGTGRVFRTKQDRVVRKIFEDTGDERESNARYSEHCPTLPPVFSSKAYHTNLII